ncbi:hypothetical protein GGU10DRAFT_355160 [Lentinula aff. detonsa]|uniref:Uncharacterized protein n=1 Tax=Lentinula aff. detonsa TaxID=2804958 RepID=A0AA38KPL0_9AGAR|nr:hypothetical protein GGU10DRAFT_355160 [Lentinula aff. detonsa]
MLSSTWRRSLLIRSQVTLTGGAQYAVRFESTISTPLPTIPHRATISGPLPWLSLAQIDEYLKPLRAHIPWTFTIASTTSRATKNGRKAGTGWSYHGRYTFRTREFGLQFAARVEDVLNDEGIPHSALQTTDFALHIPSKLKHIEPVSSSPYVSVGTPGSDPGITHQLPLQDADAYEPKFEGIVEDETVLSMTIKTHYAYIPDEILSLRPQLPATNDTPFPSTLTVPGLTIRDVRFAMLVDKIFRDEYLKTGRGLKSKQPTSLEYPSAQHMASNIFRQGFCKCCGLPHPLHECDKRKDYPPVGQCKVCGGSHWVVDCPVVRKSGGKKRAESQK